MNKFQSFEEFLSTQGIQVDLPSFLINLAIAALLGITLQKIYVRWGMSLSNRVRFGRNFIPLTMTTMLIISIVKSSLALSLGMVGALSIVRFRAAIKEPEELIYLFLAIAVGLGLGAGQTAVTVIAFIGIMSVIVARSMRRPRSESHNMHITVSARASHSAKLSEITALLKEKCSLVSLRRFDETSDTLEASFLVEFPTFAALNDTRSSLRDLDPGIRVTFLENAGVI